MNIKLSMFLSRKAVNDFKMKKLNPPEERLKELEPPPELLCSICEELMKDAVIIPCCGESYCYECIQDHLCENEFTCPSCKKENISPDDLAPNKALRKVALCTCSNTCACVMCVYMLCTCMCMHVPKI